MLWDRGEANGYIQHLSSDPYPATPTHSSMYLMAFGDHQVANVGTTVASRTIGAHVRQPALREGAPPRSSRSTASTPCRRSRSRLGARGVGLRHAGAA
ncbi:MAG: hypothetical protein U0842_15155 [Candidatus Binatia bacterium]